MARSMRSELYRTARVMGDLQAAEKGPTAYGKRVMRKKMYRRSNSPDATDTPNGRTQSLTRWGRHPVDGPA